MSTSAFEFSVVPKAPRQSKANRGYLQIDNWDDWFKYSTAYYLVIFDADLERHEIGIVKIGEQDMDPEQRSPELPDKFKSLDSTFFSLGQGADYYEKLASLDTEISEAITSGLRDVVACPESWAIARTEDVTEVSLTRSVSKKSIEGQFKRLLQGGAKLTPFQFSYRPPLRSDSSDLANSLSFSVEPNSSPPSNVHVLIGRNGVGKTRMLNLMTKVLVAEPRAAGQSGKIIFDDRENNKNTPFSGVATVSFSAFDQNELMKEKLGVENDVRYYYIGLRRNEVNSKGWGRPKTPERLANEFVSSVKTCIGGQKLRRWQRALEMLEADPIFSQAEVARLAERRSKNTLDDRARTLFSRLSSGHKIVLLTITRLVEVVEEKTLVLIDEPEAHLHPPLLSAFVRSLSDLLVNRNGVAIIATHSPVVLQEVPRECAWVIRRTGAKASVDRPVGETFGENVSVLTRDVFQLEVSQTGFHRLLTEEVHNGGTYESICDDFNDSLGAEARALLMALIKDRDSTEGEQD